MDYTKNRDVICEYVNWHVHSHVESCETRTTMWMLNCMKDRRLVVPVFYLSVHTLQLQAILSLFDVWELHKSQQPYIEAQNWDRSAARPT